MYQDAIQFERQERAQATPFWGDAANFNCGFFFHKIDYAQSYFANCTGEVIVPNSPLPADTFIQVDNKGIDIPVKGFTPLIAPIKYGFRVFCPGNYNEASAKVVPDSNIILNWTVFKSRSEFESSHQLVSIQEPVANFIDIEPDIFFVNMGNAFKVVANSQVADGYNDLRMYTYHDNMGAFCYDYEVTLRDQINRNANPYKNSYVYCKQGTGLHIQNTNSHANNRITLKVQILAQNDYRENIQKHYVLPKYLFDNVPMEGGIATSPTFDMRHYTKGGIIYETDAMFLGFVEFREIEPQIGSYVAASKAVPVSTIDGFQFACNYSWGCIRVINNGIGAGDVTVSVVLERCGSDS